MLIRKFKFFEGIINNVFVDAFNGPGLIVQTEITHIPNEIRRLRATWTPEMAQDLNAYHAIDAEAELTRVLSEELINQWGRNISDAIDDEIISRLLDNNEGGQRA